jgi:hypothetical protein
MSESVSVWWCCSGEYPDHDPECPLLLALANADADKKLLQLVCNKCGQVAVDFGVAGECGRIEMGERCKCGGIYMHKKKGGA